MFFKLVGGASRSRSVGLSVCLLVGLPLTSFTRRVVVVTLVVTVVVTVVVTAVVIVVVRVVVTVVETIVVTVVQ